MERRWSSLSSLRLVQNVLSHVRVQQPVMCKDFNEMIYLQLTRLLAQKNFNPMEWKAVIEKPAVRKDPTHVDRK